MNAFQREIVEVTAQEAGLDASFVEGLLGTPKDKKRFTYALPCFGPAKKAGKKPVELCQAIAKRLAESPNFEEASALGPFLNVRVNATRFAETVLAEVSEKGNRYGATDQGQGRNVVLDYSSPNVAKRFHIGHLRSTVIGAALYRIFEALGYNAISVNHLGDWGTQFGHVMSAFDKWGEEARLGGDDPIGYLQALYVRHNKAAKEDESYADSARAWFKRLEDGDETARTLWQRFLDVSMAEFKRVYDLLGITFDHVLGESFYADKTNDAIARCEAKGIAKLSDGALIVDFEGQGVKMEQPLLLKRSDGATLYGTRDVAAGIYRFENHDPALMIYVIGQEQRLAMKQLFSTLALLGYDEKACHHVWFGRVLGMSSRAGTAVLLDEVLGRSMEFARGIVVENNKTSDTPIEGDELESVVRAVGLGAVVFADLKNGLKKDFEFDWARIVQFKGETGPYVQYTYARMSSILRKLREAGTEVGPNTEIDPSLLADAESQSVLHAISSYPGVLVKAGRDLEPAGVAHYLLDLASHFNRFYRERRVKGAESEAHTLARLRLVLATRQTLRNGMEILGLIPIERM
ncbi:MAG: arginine--tRNA ligase [Planctomycetota bacterium]|jgi:arginyl-tRNA synthetase